jgi:drug/metabolite transporter (DMT)-like permease
MKADYTDQQSAETSSGLVIALVSNFLFTSSDAIVKFLTVKYSVFQVIAMQAAFALIPFSVMYFSRSPSQSIYITNPTLVIMRGVLAGLSTLCGFYAFSALPLAEVYSIVFCAPIIVTLASIPLLGERVGRRRLAAVCAGFIGILIMVQPGVSLLSLAHAAAFGSVVASAGVLLIMRRIGREEERIVMVAAVMGGVIVVGLPGAILHWKSINVQDLGFAAASGLLMGCAQFMALEAVRRAPASSVSPMQYTMLVWGLIFGAVIFGDPVKVNVILGSLVVIASSCYILHRERLNAPKDR